MSSASPWMGSVVASERSGQPSIRLPLLALLLASVGLLTACTEPAGEQDSGLDFFAAERVLDVNIDIAAEDWDALRAPGRTLSDILGGDCLDGPPEDIFPFYSATVSVDGETLEQVGVRKKGFLGSLSDKKPSLKIRFDKFVDGQLLGGVLKRLTLNNVQQDRSRLNTCMTYKVFADAGLPSPRCNFARVHINGADYGLFVHVESIKRAFLEHNFGAAEGNLYEGTISDFQAGWRGTFEKKNNEEEADWSDIDAVVDALEDSSPEGLEALGEVVDLDGFLSFWALEVLVGQWDGYTGNRNNYYVYRPVGGRFSFIPWGPDSSFAPIDNPFDPQVYPQSVMAQSALPHRLYGEAEYRAAYVERLRELLDTVWDESDLLAEIDRMAAIVQTHALVESRLAAQADTSRLRDFVSYRREQLLAELSPQPPEWAWPIQEPNICWEDLGTVDLEFRALWGTYGAPDIGIEDMLGEGHVEVFSYLFEGEALSFTNEGATSGLVEEGDAAGAAAVTIAHILQDGSIELLIVYTYPTALVAGAVLPFDEFVTSGYRVLIAPPFDEIRVVARLGSGALELDQASRFVGATVSGRIHGTWYGFGGAP